VSPFYLCTRVVYGVLIVSEATDYCPTSRPLCSFDSDSGVYRAPCTSHSLERHRSKRNAARKTGVRCRRRFRSIFISGILLACLSEWRALADCVVRESVIGRVRVRTLLVHRCICICVCSCCLYCTGSFAVVVHNVTYRNTVQTTNCIVVFNKL